MTVRILYPQNIKSALLVESTTDALLDLPTLASSMSGAKYLLEEAAAGFLSSNYLPRFILSAEDVDLDRPTDTDFKTVVVKITLDDNTVDVFALEEAVEKWATYSDVSSARGDRIALISNVDKIQKDGKTVLIWEVALSTFIRYSFRRAVAYFPRTQDEATADMKSLLKRVDLVSTDLNSEIYPV